MTRYLFLFILCLFILQNLTAQYTLSVRQVGMERDSIPRLIIGDIKEEPKRLNDSTIQFNVPLTGNDEPLFVMMGHRWFTRIWIDSANMHKELIIDYAKRTTHVINGNEIDITLEEEIAFHSKRQD